jgi:hypothetical protein
MGVRRQGPENLHGGGVDSGDDRELRHHRPQPAARREFAPAVAEVPEGARRLRGRQAVKPHARPQGAGDGEGRGIGRQGPSGAGQAGQDAAQRRAADRGGIATGPEERVRLRQLARLHDLRKQPLRGRVVEAEARAAGGGDGRELPDVSLAGEEEHRRDALGHGLQRLGRHHHVMTGRAVCDRPAEEEGADHGDQLGRGDVADIAGRSASQHRDRHRHRCDLRAAHGDDAAGAQQPEVTAAQRSTEQCLPIHRP